MLFVHRDNDRTTAPRTEAALAMSLMFHQVNRHTAFFAGGIITIIITITKWQKHKKR